jgi:hypothetical protein
MAQNPATPTPAERRQARESRRAQALAMRVGGASFLAIGDALGVTPVRARQIFLHARYLATRPQWHNALPARAVGFLRLHVGDLPEPEAAAAFANRFTRKQLRRQPDVGPGAYAALIDWLAQHGLTLRAEPTTECKTGGPDEESRPFDFSRQSQAGVEVQGKCSISPIAR